jgi:hypothetical protein
MIASRNFQSYNDCSYKTFVSGGWCLEENSYSYFIKKNKGKEELSPCLQVVFFDYQPFPILKSKIERIILILLLLYCSCVF